jgi:hypothetical protein
MSAGGENVPNAPKGSASPLTPQQEQAIEYLAAGTSVVKTAELVSVDRTTIYRWLHDPDFQAGLHQRRREVYLAIQLRLMAVTDRALDNHAKAIEEGDLPTSRFHLQHLLAKTVPGLEAADPQYLRAIADLEAGRRQLDEGQRRLAEAEQTLVAKGCKALLKELHPELDVDGLFDRLLTWIEVECRAWVPGGPTPHQPSPTGANVAAGARAEPEVTSTSPDAREDAAHGERLDEITPPAGSSENRSGPDVTDGVAPETEALSPACGPTETPAPVPAPPENDNGVSPDSGAHED